MSIHYWYLYFSRQEQIRDGGWCCQVQRQSCKSEGKSAGQCAGAWLLTMSIASGGTGGVSAWSTHNQPIVSHIGLCCAYPPRYCYIIIIISSNTVQFSIAINWQLISSHSTDSYHHIHVWRWLEPCWRHLISVEAGRNMAARKAIWNMTPPPHIQQFWVQF